MNFLKFSFTYIFLFYIGRGEKYSAHIYSLSLLTLLVSCNFLSIFFFLFSQDFLSSKDFKTIVLLIFGILLSCGYYYFIKKGKHWQLAEEYKKIEKFQKRKFKVCLLIYFLLTVVVLITSML